MKQRVTKAAKIALCRRCGGRGTIMRPAGAIEFSEDIEDLAAVAALRRFEPCTCPQCGGSGRVLVSAEMELDIRPYNPDRQA